MGDSDGYQVRVDVRSGRLPAGLRVDLVDPGSSRADGQVGAGRAMQSAVADTAQPAVLTRAQWGADESLRGTGPRYTGTPKAGFVHHTAGTNGYSEADVPRIIRGIYAYHVKGNGWSDIGYNYLVDRFGRLWEGRYGGVTMNVLGAHTGGFNVDSFAVSAIGDYEKAAAPPVMVDSIARLMAWKLATAYRDPNGTTVLTSQGGGTSRYRAGTRVTFNVISGHRDAGNTECPGKNLYAQLPLIRQLTTQYLGTALMDPTPTPASATYGKGGTITTTARVTSDQSWTMQVTDVCRGTVVRTLTGTASPTVPLAAAWDLRDDAGNPVRPGAYTVTLASADATAAARTWTGQVTVNAARTAPPAAAAVALPGRTAFVPVDPIKLYDTHDDGNLPLGPGGRVDLVVPGAGKVPAEGVAAVALSISSSCATADTTVTAWAGGAAKPSSPALNVTGRLHLVGTRGRTARRQRRRERRQQCGDDGALGARRRLLPGGRRAGVPADQDAAAVRLEPRPGRGARPGQPADDHDSGAVRHPGGVDDRRPAQRHGRLAAGNRHPHGAVAGQRRATTPRWPSRTGRSSRPAPSRGCRTARSRSRRTPPRPTSSSTSSAGGHRPTSSAAGSSSPRRPPGCSTPAPARRAQGQGRQGRRRRGQGRRQGQAGPQAASAPS